MKPSFSHAWLRWVLLAVFVFAGGFFLQGTSQTAFADFPDMPTEVTISQGTGPEVIIQCKFEILGTRSSTATSFTPTADDDNPAVDADPPPCIPPALGFPPSPMAQNRQHMIQLLPNPHDEFPPGTRNLRQYEKWVSVWSPTVGAIIDAHFIVHEPLFDPDGPTGPFPANCGPGDPRTGTAHGGPVVTFPTDPATPGGINNTGPNKNVAEYCFKYQHHATATRDQPTTSNPLVGWSMLAGDRPCTDLQSAANTARFNQAIATGQLTQAEVDFMIAECFENKKRIFRVQEDVSKEQPCGEYRIEARIVTLGGATSMVNFFDVLCFEAEAEDFNNVLFPNAPNNQSTVVNGNFVMEPCPATGPCNNPPTVQNQGNLPSYLTVHFDPMFEVGVPTGAAKQITRFDVKARASYRTNPNQISAVERVHASTTICFAAQPVAFNQTIKLDLSVFPENVIPGTTFRGSVDLFLVPAINPAAGLDTLIPCPTTPAPVRAVGIGSFSFDAAGNPIP